MSINAIQENKVRENFRIYSMKMAGYSKFYSVDAFTLRVPEPRELWLKKAQRLSGRVLDPRPKGRGFKPHRRHCVVVLGHIYPSSVLVQPRKTRPCLSERLLMGHKESNQTNTKNDFKATHDRVLLNPYIRWRG